MTASARSALAASCQRELAANCVNRFLHVHLALAAAAGFLPLFTPDDTTGAAPLWVLHAVLYCLSLSSLLLGLSSAHAEADEFSVLFAQPAPRWAWLLGKMIAVTVVLATASLLLVLPAAIIGGLTAPLAEMAIAAWGVTLALSAVGLGIGFWIRDPVRGLLGAMGVWFGLLFGADLLLLAASGVPWIHAHPGLWVAALMGNPLDAFRITVLFSVERAAFAGLDAGGVVRWWIGHGWSWLTALVLFWSAGGFLAGLRGAQRRLDA
jgi:Cu-processing system permease protein